jgi:hypothetical protein
MVVICLLKGCKHAFSMKQGPWFSIHQYRTFAVIDTFDILVTINVALQNQFLAVTSLQTNLKQISIQIFLTRLS